MLGSYVLVCVLYSRDYEAHVAARAAPAASYIAYFGL